MNRAHAYKAAVQENESAKANDPDKGINMGLFCYPILMAADILMFKAHKVPVGKDQIQHLEMARDIAMRFNHTYGETFVLPEAVTSESTAVLQGLDGRKMSKSYNNTIPLFLPAKQLRKLIMKIKTNSQGPDEPKDPESCTLFQVYRAFAKPEEIKAMRMRYGDTIYFHNRDTLWINLFIASELNWKDKAVTIRQETKFPQSDMTSLTVKVSRPTEFDLRLRVPHWASRISRCTMRHTPTRSRRWTRRPWPGRPPPAR